MFENVKYVYNPPWIIKRIFSKYQWNSMTPNILLTFDDGPNPGTTEIILKELNKHSIKGIFFTVGENLQKYPALGKEILSEGHDIGNHTNKHEILTKLSFEDASKTIEKVQHIAQELFSYNITYFRPPHGRFNLSTSKMLSQFNLTNVMWSLLTYDYQNDLNIVKFALNNYLRNDSIIVLHDSNKSKDIVIDSIKFIAEKASELNYKIGKPSECLRYYS